MRLKQQWLLAVFCLTFLSTSPIAAQQLKEMGVLATGVLSRTRIGGGDFQSGDMIYVTAFHPANSGKIFVSAHMEYLDKNKKWSPVPTKGDTELGQEYTSGNFPGLRDYVKFEGSNSNHIRHICLFMPYKAADLPINKKYTRRYSLRVWDDNNEPVERTILTPEQIATTRDENGNFVMTTVTAKACSSMPAPKNTDPVPESKNSGLLRFFDTKSGSFVCPASE